MRVAFTCSGSVELGLGFVSRAALPVLRKRVLLTASAGQ
jgi:spore coat polysaccharide biosynthesis predicted glycosyltransferase SpsG